ncbi:hypothetical protein G6F56_011191 [Rhizopus delemar]|nr:hypothetical protein G6F56_011191 [Rhizopus delemar]
MMSTGSGTFIAKKFIWDGLELTKAAIPYIGKTLGLDGVEESMNFLKELKSCMEQKDCYLDSIAISVQKL